MQIKRKWKSLSFKAIARTKRKLATKNYRGVPWSESLCLRSIAQYPLLPISPLKSGCLILLVIMSKAIQKLEKTFNQSILLENYLFKRHFPKQRHTEYRFPLGDD